MTKDISDEYRIRSLNKALEKAEFEGRAVQNAMQAHPVIDYVLGLPVQSPLYPANRYLRLSNRLHNSQEGQMFHDLDDSVQEGDAFQESDRSASVFVSADSSEVVFPFKEGVPIGDLITWSIPGHDDKRSTQKGCGVIRAKDRSVVYTACEADSEHHLKAKQKHCWSLHCPKCMNDTALKNAIKAERQLLMYRTLRSKEGVNVGDVSHFVVSPPQDFMKSAMQTYDSFDAVCIYIESQLTKYGASAGFSVFHPWRQGRDRWVLSPHFHVMLYGFIDTASFLRENPGWIIKKIHAREKIRSIRHTVAYLMTHMGLGTVEVDPSSVEWDVRVLDLMIPGILSPGAKYTEKDYNDLGEGRGRLLGDVSGIDWVQWTMDRLSRDIRTRYWGDVARKKIVTVDVYRQYKIRVCKQCHAFLRVYEGFDDVKGDYVRYIQDNPVMCFATNLSLVRSFFLRYKSALPEGTTIADIAKLIPTAASTLELPIPQNDDLVMSGPFDEPDSFFILRQNRAFGTDGGTA